MAAIICMFAVFIIPLNVVEILALNVTGRCPTYEEVGGIDIDLEKYSGTWYDFYHSDLDYTCAVDVHSSIRNSTGYYFKLDYVFYALDGTEVVVHDVADPSGIIAKGYKGYDLGNKFMNAFLDVDYDKYSIEFYCDESDDGPQNLLYLITRSMEIDDSVVKKLEYYNNKLELGYSIKNYSKECKGLKM